MPIQYHQDTFRYAKYGHNLNFSSRTIVLNGQKSAFAEEYGETVDLLDIIFHFSVFFKHKIFV